MAKVRAKAVKEKAIDEDLIRLPEGNKHIHGCGHPVRAVVLCDDPLAFTDSEWPEWAQEHAEIMQSTVGDRMKCKCYFCYAKERGILGAFKGMHESVKREFAKRGKCPHGKEVGSDGIIVCKECTQALKQPVREVCKNPKCVERRALKKGIDSLMYCKVCKLQHVWEDGLSCECCSQCSRLNSTINQRKSRKQKGLVQSLSGVHHRKRIHRRK